MRNIIALIVLCFAITLASDTSAQGALVVKGQIEQDFSSSENFSLEVVVNGEEIHQIPLSKKGKYHVVTYSGDAYDFNFYEDGKLMKTVTLDARVPDDIAATGTIKFDVVLTEVSHLMLDDINLIALEFNTKTGEIDLVSSKTTVFTASLRVK